MSGPLRGLADSLAGVDALPTPARAVFSHYAAGGSLELAAIRLQQRVEDEIERIVEDAYADVEAALADEFGRESVAFSYDTKLTLPVELTLAHVYRRATAAAPPGIDPVSGRRATDPISKFRRRRADAEADPVELVRETRRAREVAELVVVALLDGDMRDAINDGEYEDFGVDFELAPEDRARVASIAQEVLQAAVQEQFAAFPDEVRAAYDAAVDRSEAHQDRDPHFRELMADALAENRWFSAANQNSASSGDVAAAETEAVEEAAIETDESDRDDLDAAAAREALREEYKHPAFDDPPALFEEAELDLPYLVTQYGRVGVIYHGMVEMFREAGIDLSPEFERAVVLSIIGAQIWLDDVDDFAADVREGQLTPVTAEYLLADSDSEAYGEVVAIAESYLDAARDAAAASNAPITGIAVEYIRHDGDLEKLPR
ncbi:hypothetical protein [Halolamina salifodinae]|uniref:Uncharacterized protein n=1 Tax=Halolamina salifodinae TaxID=1202767 RepID=A0A8T4GWM4_9EURY|nr:hypothetical protein [Halolamina salifodinae]MBP1987521.1 hypothetical protein [Halolamina salifodinae]